MKKKLFQDILGVVDRLYLLQKAQQPQHWK
jgi:hypothetical protein